MSKPTTTIFFYNTSIHGLANEGETNGIQGVATLAT
jgi:hypothetical protein